jgi:hypothetical protein
LFLAERPAAAQTGPQGLKGFNATQAQMKYLQAQSYRHEPYGPRSVPLAARPHMTQAVPPLEATVIVVPAARPLDAPAPALVNVRGPDGTVRSFPIEGGLAAIKVQTVVVHAGESVTLRLPATTARK